MSFSIKTLLGFTATIALLIFSLTKPSLLLATALQLFVCVCLVKVVRVRKQKNRLTKFLVVCTSAVYMIVADGFLQYQLPVRYYHLPVEMLLNQHPIRQEYFELSPGHDSLTAWTLFTILEECNKALGVENASCVDVSSDSVEIEFPDGTTWTLSEPQSAGPIFLVHVENGIHVRTVYRATAMYKPYFVIGHCWFVVFFLGLVYWRLSCLDCSWMPQVPKAIDLLPKTCTGENERN